jgi:hypothetical protein
MISYVEALLCTCKQSPAGHFKSICGAKTDLFTRNHSKEVKLSPLVLARAKSLTRTMTRINRSDNAPNQSFLKTG